MKVRKAIKTLDLLKLETVLKDSTFFSPCFQPMSQTTGTSVHCLDTVTNTHHTNQTGTWKCTTLELMLRKYRTCNDKRKVVTALRILMDRFEPTRLRSFPLRDVLIRTSKTPSGKYVEAVRVQMLLWANHSSDTTPPYASPRPKKSSGATESIANDMSQNTSDIVKANATKLWTWTCNACSYVVFEQSVRAKCPSAKAREFLILTLTSIHTLLSKVLESLI